MGSAIEVISGNTAFLRINCSSISFSFLLAGIKKSPRTPKECVAKKMSNSGKIHNRIFVPYCSIAAACCQAAAKKEKIYRAS